MHKLFIGCPFGNYFHWRDTVRTLGTYTFHYRAGFWRRLWRILKTVRYNRRTQSWVNNLGLPNPGLASLKSIPADAVLSIHGFTAAEWTALVQLAAKMGATNLEFNLSCPNVDKAILAEVLPAIALSQTLGVTVVAKLPPIGWASWMAPLYDAGVANFHLCNTLPGPNGGRSGKCLKPLALSAVEEAKIRWPHSCLIGGGGITGLDDVKDFLNAGADNISVASMLFNPFNWCKVPLIRDFLALHSQAA